MSITIHQKKPAELLFGNKRVASMYRGSKLVWEHVVKRLVEQYMHDQCVLFIPTQDITLSSISFFATNGSTDTHAVFRVFNEVGICIAYSSGNGVEIGVTLYGKTGSLKTSTNAFGTPTLYAGQKYYLNITGPNSSGMTGSKYENLTSNQKLFSNAEQWTAAYSGTAWTHKCSGSASSFSDISSIPIDNYFVWRGEQFQNGMLPNETGTNNPYPYLLKRDMSHVKRIFTDNDFNGLNDDMARYAFIYYAMGNRPDDEFIMNVSGWDSGFNINGTRVFSNSKNKIYKLNSIITGNHITSMTPIDEEPQNPNFLDVYYKSSNRTWGSISQRAVVIWFDGRWEIATSWETEFGVDTQLNATNYVEKIGDWRAKDFNALSEQSGDKLYYRINGVEI